MGRTSEIPTLIAELQEEYRRQAASDAETVARWNNNRALKEALEAA